MCFYGHARNGHCHLVRDIWTQAYGRTAGGRSEEAARHKEELEERSCFQAQVGLSSGFQPSIGILMPSCLVRIHSFVTQGAYCRGVKYLGHITVECYKHFKLMKTRFRASCFTLLLHACCERGLDTLQFSPSTNHTRVLSAQRFSFSPGVWA